MTRASATRTRCRCRARRATLPGLTQGARAARARGRASRSSCRPKTPSAPTATRRSGSTGRQPRDRDRRSARLPRARRRHGCASPATASRRSCSRPTGAPASRCPKTDPPETTEVEVAQAGHGPGRRRRRHGRRALHRACLGRRRGLRLDAGDRTRAIRPRATRSSSVGEGGQVIPGFSEAIIGQKVGSQIGVIVPPSEGYGDQGERAGSPRTRRCSSSSTSWA